MNLQIDVPSYAFILSQCYTLMYISELIGLFVKSGICLHRVHFLPSVATQLNFGINVTV